MGRAASAVLPLALCILGSNGQDTFFSCSGSVQTTVTGCQDGGGWCDAGGPPASDGGGSSPSDAGSPGPGDAGGVDGGQAADGGSSGTITVTPASATLFLGQSAPFTASSTIPDDAPTWSASCAAPADQIATVTSSGLVTIEALGTGPATCTVTATSAVNPSVSGSATISVPADPSGMAGDLYYSGSATGPVYVLCTDENAFPQNSGLAFIPDANFSSPVEYRILGASCGGTTLAFMDTLGSGEYVYEADPAAIQVVPADNPHRLDLTLSDPWPTADAPMSATGPSVTQILPESAGATLMYAPFLDSEGNEWAQKYLVTTTTNPTSSDTTACSIVPANPYDLAFVERLSPGLTYYFGIQPYTGQGTLVCPPANEVPTWFPSGGVAIPTGGGSPAITGEVATSALQPVPTTSDFLHAIAYQGPAYQGLNTSAGAAGASVTSGFTSFAIPDLSSGSPYQLGFFVDTGSKGWLEQSDYIGVFFNPLYAIESMTGLSPAMPYAPSAAGVQPGSFGPFTLQQEAASVAALSYIDWTSTSTYQATVLYVVTPGETPIAEAARLGWSYDDVPAQDLPSYRMAEPAPVPSGFFYLGLPPGTTSTPPPTNVAIPFQLTAVDGSQSSQTAYVEDVLDDNIAVDISGASMSDEVTVSWTAPALHYSGNYIDHYDVDLFAESGGVIASTSTIVPGNTTSLLAELPAVGGGSADGGSGSAQYFYELAAVDSFGDLAVTSGMFPTDGGMPPDGGMGAPPDGGSPSDGGTGSSQDGGSGADGGVSPDGGSGTCDAGCTSDGGTSPDGGTSSDGGVGSGQDGGSGDGGSCDGGEGASGDAGQDGGTSPDGGSCDGGEGASGDAGQDGGAAGGDAGEDDGGTGSGDGGAEQDGGTAQCVPNVPNPYL